MKLLLTLGLHVRERGASFRYDEAVLALVDWESRRVLRELSYRSPPDHAALAGHMLFASGHLRGRELLVTTHTEVLSIDLRRWEITRRISSPHFNDLHHVLPATDDSLYVCNTGLQAVQRVNWSGTVLESHGTDGVPTWDVYERERDYRPLSTRPHVVHPNFLFSLEGRIFVTRSFLHDAVAIDDPSRRLSIDVGMPHDGVVLGRSVYFTTTNGHVVVVDARSGRRTADIDLNVVDGRRSQLGWCRGLHVLSPELALVGFTQFRRARHKEFAHWILDDGKAALPSRVVLYDLATPRRLQEMTLTGRWEGASIYSILPWVE